jgi:hypothetical protein
MMQTCRVDRRDDHVPPDELCDVLFLETGAARCRRIFVASGIWRDHQLAVGTKETRQHVGTDEAKKIV